MEGMVLSAFYFVVGFLLGAYTEQGFSRKKGT